MLLFAHVLYDNYISGMAYTNEHIQAMIDMPGNPIFGRFIRFTLDNKGNVKEILHRRENLRFASFAEELARAGNISEYFKKQSFSFHHWF